MGILVYEGLKVTDMSPREPAFEDKRFLLSNDILVAADLVSHDWVRGFASSKLKVASVLTNDYHVLIEDIGIRLQRNTTIISMKKEMI